MPWDTEVEETDDLLPQSQSLGLDEAPPPYLVVCSGGARRAHALPRGGVLVVGRSLEAQVRLEEATVSRAHLELRSDGGVTYATDLGSQHGTSIGEVRLEGPRELGGPAVISAGRAVLAFYPDTRAPSPSHHVGAVPVWALDAGMVRAYAQLEHLAASTIPTLLLGETGVGKEVAARALHQWSARAQGPFVAINCAALPDTLVEAELFGYERGAFSSADHSRAGLFEAAHGGTLFLDEVGELPVAAQAKLLRVLESRTVQRLGDGGQEREIDVRVVAATNAPLADELSARGFRRDLYYRLAGATVTLPPLRERPLELVALTLALLAQACDDLARERLVLSAHALTALLQHPWSGNVRELRHLMDYLAAGEGAALVRAKHIKQWLSRGSAPRRSVLPAPPAPSSFRPIDQELRELERHRMAAALHATGGNRTRAAELISMPRRTFLTKLKQYDLADEGRAGAED
jgi:DNA-binding NtrC family response regulator